MSSLKKATVKRTLWASVDLFGQQGIQFFVSIILARLLEPSEFGLLAMLGIFTSIATALTEGGFGGALMQRLKVSNTDKSTVFWYNLWIGIIFVMLFWISAPAIADFYNQPRLILIIRWSIWTIFINCFGLVHRSMLQKSLRFREQSIVSVVSIIISGIISVFLAIQGYGVWSLVAQGLSLAILQVLGLWIVYPWVPRFVFDKNVFKEMFAFGHNLMISMIIRNIFQNIYQMIIGKSYSATILGYYYRSKRFTILASQLPTTTTERVCFPTLSQFQNEQERMIQGYKNFLSVTMLIVVPLLTGLMITAPNFICVLIGEKWLPSVLYFRILIFSALFFPVHVLSSSTLSALGKSRASLNTEIIKYVLISISIIGLYRSGIVALLIGEAISTFLAAFVSLYYVAKYLKISVFIPIKWLIPVFSSSVVMGIGLAFILSAQKSISALIIKIIAGIFIYLIGLVLLRYPLVLVGFQKLKSKIITLNLAKNELY